jgi:hypothetical protein
LPQDNLRREQRAVMDINCITISKILTPLQAAHYMVNAYPQHCDALALRWGGSEGHEPGTAELCCAGLGWAVPATRKFCYTQVLTDILCPFSLSFCPAATRWPTAWGGRARARGRPPQAARQAMANADLRAAAADSMHGSPSPTQPTLPTIDPAVSPFHMFVDHLFTQGHPL